MTYEKRTNRNYYFGLIVVFLFHLLLYLTVLFQFNFVPYLFDANETFSVFWHSHNLLHFPKDSFGLTDEAFSPNVDAHPFFYTHQGNMPRIFGAAIYALGARTVESQVLVTTITIGSLGIFFVYAFLYKISNLLFALLFTFLLMLDCVLYAQWHVVPFRVWYTVVLFGPLFLCIKLIENPSKYYSFFLGISFFLLFYSELIFAFFALFVFFSFFLLSAPKKIKIFIVPVFLGSALAITILSLQNIFVFGLETFLRDIQYTFLSRNMNSFEHRDTIKSFFYANNIVFWENFQDGNSLRSIDTFFSFIFRFGIDVWLRPTALILSAVGVAAAVAFLPISADKKGFRNVSNWFFLSILILIVFSPGYALGLGVPLSGYLNYLFIFVFAIVVIVLALFGRKYFLGVDQYTVGFLFIISSYVFIGVFWPTAYPELSKTIFDNNVLRFLIKISIVMYCISIIGALEQLKSGFPELRSAARFFVIFLAVSILVFMVSPGYLATGYAWRFAPFFVYFLTVIPTLALYIPFKHCIANRRWGGRALSLVGFFSASFVFLATNFQYYKSMPFDRYQVLKEALSKVPIGSSAAVNNFSAPVAYLLQNWATMDFKIGLGLYDYFDKNPSRTVGDPLFYWFSDRKMNKAYSRPDYFVCFLPSNLVQIENIKSGNSVASCRNLPLVVQAKNGTSPFRDEIVSISSDGNVAVVKLSDSLRPRFFGVPSINIIDQGGKFLVAPIVSAILDEKDGLMIEKIRIFRANEKCVNDGAFAPWVDTSDFLLDQEDLKHFSLEVQVKTSSGVEAILQSPQFFLEGDTIISCGYKEKLDFSTTGNMHLGGFHAPEAWGAWMASPQVRLPPLLKSYFGSSVRSGATLVLRIEGITFRQGGDKIAIMVNDKVIGSLILSEPFIRYGAEWSISDEFKDPLVVEFTGNEPTQPSNSDSRRLSAGLISVELNLVERIPLPR